MGFMLSTVSMGRGVRNVVLSLGRIIASLCGPLVLDVIPVMSPYMFRLTE